MTGNVITSARSPLLRVTAFGGTGNASFRGPSGALLSSSVNCLASLEKFSERKASWEQMPTETNSSVSFLTR